MKFFNFISQSILGEFNKEQEAFIKEKEGKGNGTAVPPWSGCPNEAVLKEQCLALSTVCLSYYSSTERVAIISKIIFKL